MMEYANTRTTVTSNSWNHAITHIVLDLTTITVVLANCFTYSSDTVKHKIDFVLAFCDSGIM